MSSRWAKAIAIVVVIWGLLLGGRWLIWQAGLEWLPRLVEINDQGAQVTREETNEYPAAGLEAVRAETRNGAITIKGTDGDQVVVTVKYLARSTDQAASQDKLARLRTDVSQSNGTLSIRAMFDSAAISGQQISLELSVPQEMLVQADTSNGAINVNGMAGKLQLTTQNGGIRVDSELGPRELLADTKNGAIVVSSSPDSGSYTLKTANGKIEAKLPAALGIELDGSVGNGSLDIGEGQWSITGGKISSRQVQATRGDGALKLNVRSSNGQIIISTK